MVASFRVILTGCLLLMTGFSQGQPPLPNSYSHAQPAQPIQPVQPIQPAQPHGRRRYEVDVDTYKINPTKTAEGGKPNNGSNISGSGNQTEQIGYRYEYDYIEPDPTTTPAPFVYPHYQGHFAPPPQPWQPVLAPPSNVFPVSPPAVPPTYPAVNQLLAKLRQNLAHRSAYQRAASWQSYPSQSNFLYPTRLGQQEEHIPALQQARNTITGYQSPSQAPPFQAGTPFMNALKMLTAQEMHCKPLYEVYRFAVKKYHPSTCGGRLRCPAYYSREIQIGQVCVCCPYYLQLATLEAKTYRKGMDALASVSRTKRTSGD